MAREFQRAERVADFLQRELATLISREIRDPRIHLVDVTAVHVTRDLGHAKVFVTFPGDSTEEQDSERVEVLNRAGGYLRSQLAKDSSMRSTPALKFVYDQSIRRGSYLTNLIDKALESDRRNADESARGDSDSVDSDPDDSNDSASG